MDQVKVSIQSIKNEMMWLKASIEKLLKNYQGDAVIEMDVNKWASITYIEDQMEIIERELYGTK